MESLCGNIIGLPKRAQIYARRKIRVNNLKSVILWFGLCEVERVPRPTWCFPHYRNFSFHAKVGLNLLSTNTGVACDVEVGLHDESELLEGYEKGLWRAFLKKLPDLKNILYL